MSWRVAKALDVLLAEVNAAAPGRNKASDGSIGDAAHSSRTSDHNPNASGVVCARDYTHDPSAGADMHKLAEHLRSTQDPRVKYVIWNRRIMAGNAGPSPWAWRSYSGTNPHTKHLHLSVSGDYDSLKPWGWTDEKEGTVDLAVKQGDSGQVVKYWQGRLRFVDAYTGKIDGDYGPKMAAAVKQVAGGDGSTLYWYAALRIDVAVAQKAAGAAGASASVDLEKIASELTITVKR